MSYIWEDDDGNAWQSPLTDDRTRGRCTGIPECCIDAFIDGEVFFKGMPDDWGYRPCPTCAANGNRIEPRSCGDLKDACTCGTWAGRKPLEDDRDFDIDQLRRDVAGFSGRFEFRPEHTEDQGIGNIADVVDVEDALVFIPDVDKDNVYTIASPIEQHVAEPLARMLNAVGPLLDLLEDVRAGDEG